MNHIFMKKNLNIFQTLPICSMRVKSDLYSSAFMWKVRLNKASRNFYFEFFGSLFARACHVYAWPYKENQIISISRAREYRNVLF